MTSKAQRAAELAALLTFEKLEYEHAQGADMDYPSPRIVAADVVALLRIGASVARWAVRYCNGEGREWRQWPNGGGSYVWGDADDAAKEKADASALKRASEIAARYGATVEIGGDPRGYVLRLHLASGRNNGWGEGWGVA